MANAARPLPVNANGVPQYPKGHSGRLLAVMAAIDLLERPTAYTIAGLTGLSKGNIDRYVSALNAELGTQVQKDATGQYLIESWGKILNPEGVKSVLTIGKY